MYNNNFSYKNVADKLNNIFNNFNDIIMKDVELDKKIKIHKFLGEGSYGVVFKVIINDRYFALKLSDNEIPDRLIKRYNSLIDDKKNKLFLNFFIDIDFELL